jgi:DGQHR domain-containing protein
MSSNTMSASHLRKVPGVAEENGRKIRGAVVVQRGEVMLFGAMPAEDLVRRARVDVYEPEHRTGYQRERIASRAKAASYYYEQGGRFPNPILVNIREEDFEKVRVDVDDQEGYEEAVEARGHWIGGGYIELPEDVTLWVYDGQHRQGGVEELVERNPMFSVFPVPIAVTLGLDEDAEMNEFYQVNTNAKSVKTDLAWELLRKRAAKDPELAGLLEERGRDWIIKAEDVIDELVKLEGPWSDSIQRPNQKKVKTDRLTLPAAQFVRSLKPVLDMPLLAKADANTVGMILNAYWMGIAKVMPEPFDPSKSPKDWVIQKGPGAIAFHRVLPQVIEVVRAKGKGLADVDAYAEVLADVPQLRGQITTEDGDVDEISGAQFWRSGPQGVASAFTGDAGRKRLGIMIQAMLPRPIASIVL